jgi:hypothetical protein
MTQIDLNTNFSIFAIQTVQDDTYGLLDRFFAPCHL